MADFFSGSLQSRAARGNFQSMMGSPAYESRYISFDEFIRSKGPEAAMRARDPISFRGLWSEYSNRYPQSARIAVTQDAFRQMGGESPVEQGIRQSRDYKDYMREMKAAGAEEFMLTPQSFAASDVRKREKGRETMQEFYKGAGTGKPVGDMSPDAGFKKRDGEKMVKVPVGPRGELQLENIKGGERATRFRMIPESEVSRMQEDIKLRGMQPRVVELEARMGRAEKVEGQLGEEARKQSELAEFSRLLSENPIMSRPEYASKIKDGQALINAGSSAKDAMLYVEGRGGMLDVEQKKSIELIEARGRVAAQMKALGFAYDQAAAEIANAEKERVRKLAADAATARDAASRERARASFELQKQNTLLGIIDDINALERALPSFISKGDDVGANIVRDQIKALEVERADTENININELPVSGDIGSELAPTVWQQPYGTPAPSLGGGMYSIRLSNGRVIENIREQDLQEALRKFSQAGLSPSAQRM